MSKLELKCKVTDGMFSNEVQATIQTGYEEVETLITRGFVKNGKLALQVEHETDEDIYVFVPGDVVKGSHFIKVNKKHAEVVNEIRNCS